MRHHGKSNGDVKHMLPDGGWYGVYAGLLAIGLIMAIVAAPLNGPVRVPVFTVGSVAMSAGILAAIGCVLQYIYLPS